MCKCNPNRHADCGCKIKPSINSDGTGMIVYNWCREHSDQISRQDKTFVIWKKAWVARIRNDEKM